MHGTRIGREISTFVKPHHRDDAIRTKIGFVLHGGPNGHEEKKKKKKKKKVSFE